MKPTNFIFQIKENFAILVGLIEKLTQFLTCFLSEGMVLAALFEATLERLSEERALVILRLQVLAV